MITGYSLITLFGILIALIGAIILVKNVKMPGNFFENQEKRNKLKQRMVDLQNKNIIED